MEKQQLAPNGRHMLSARQEMFACWFGQLGEIAPAYQAAFPEEDATHRQAYDKGWGMLQSPAVKARAIAWRAEQTADLKDDIRALAAFYRAGITAERALVQHIRVNCRYCHGAGGRKQWTLEEYLTELEAAEHFNRVRGRAPERMLPDPQGGFGFDAWKEPNPDCEKCRGRGEGMSYIGDMRAMAPDEAMVFEGAEIGANGAFKAKYMSKVDAAAGLMKLRGIGAENVNLHLSPPPEAAAVVVPRDPQRAAEVYREFMSGRLLAGPTDGA